MAEREHGSGAYTTHVYRVEARATGHEVVLDYPKPDGFNLPLVLTTHEWKLIPTNTARLGVPNQLSPLYAEAQANGFLTYECAMTLACWLQAEQRWGAIETRVVQIEFVCSYSTRELGTSEPLNLHKDDMQLSQGLRQKREELAAGRHP